MRKPFSFQFAAVLVVWFSSSMASAQFILITWNGNGDGMSWNDADNWDLGIVPNAANHVAVFDSVMGDVVLDDRLGPTVTVHGICFINSDGLTLTSSGTQLEYTGFGIDFEQPELKVDNSQVDLTAPLSLLDTTIFNFDSPQLFAFSSLTLGPMNTNGNGVAMLNPKPDNTVLVNLTEDVTDNGNMSFDGLMFVNLLSSITVDVDELYATQNASVLVNPATLLLADNLTLRDSSVTFVGGAPPTNHIPMVQSIASSRGTLGFQQGNNTIDSDIHIERGNTTFDARNAAILQQVLINGTITFGLGGTLNLLYSPVDPILVEVADIQGADPNGVVPTATVNGDNFARFDSPTGELQELLAYVSIVGAGVGDAAEAAGNVTLTDDVDVSVVKATDSILDGGDNTITTDAILAKGNNVISNTTLMPHDQPNNNPNGFPIHLPAGGDLLELEADIADNNQATELTVNAQGGQMTVSTALSKTGVTNVSGTGGRVTLEQGASFGGTQVITFAGVELVLVNNEFNQDNTVHTGPVPVTIEADGASTINGNITVVNNSAGDGDVVLTAPQPDDSLTIKGDVVPGGMGNDVLGQRGNVVVNIGTPTDEGKTTIGAGADWTDGDIVTVLDGDSLRQIVIDGDLGTAVIVGSADVSGIGSMTMLTDGLPGETPSSARHTLSPGESIGTFTIVEDLLMRGSEFTYAAEIDDAGNSDLIAIGGTMDISTPSDTLDISFFTGNTLAGVDYTLATYGARIGIFDTVMFDGSPVADPTAPGAIGGTHRLLYRTDALVLMVPEPSSLLLLLGALVVCCSRGGMGCRSSFGRARSLRYGR